VRPCFGAAAEYLVAWVGYGLEEASWEPADRVPEWYRAMLDNRHPVEESEAEDKAAEQRPLVVRAYLPLDPDQDGVASVPVGAVKRGRGRPRKQPL
jgi:hypothetical protein